MLNPVVVLERRHEALSSHRADNDATERELENSRTMLRPFLLGQSKRVDLMGQEISAGERRPSEGRTGTLGTKDMPNAL